MAEMMAAMRTTPKVELEDDDFNSLSMSSRYSPMASSISPIDTLSRDPATDRRPSVASSTASAGQEFYSTTSGSTASPSTPFSAEYMGIVPSGDSIICVPNDLNLQDIYSGWENADQGMDAVWPTTESRCHHSAPFLDYSSTGTLGGQDVFNDSTSSSDWHLLSTSAANLSFSRGILDEHQLSSESLSADSMGQWIPTMVHTPPQTVAPNATFQPILTSSPCKLEPMTPLTYPAPAPASILSSSPCHLYSPEQMFAQEEYELAERLLEAMPMTPKQIPKVRRGGGRTSRPTYERKCITASGRMKSAISKSGMGCDVVIEGNKYACEFADCIDKNGKRKMFKRREHAKRHVDTVHLKKKQFRCWVPGCTTQPFTRSDNLTTHLKSTHGKKSVSSRNRYVSTLDPASENFDPEWRGDLDDNGQPVDDHDVML